MDFTTTDIPANVKRGGPAKTPNPFADPAALDKITTVETVPVDEHGGTVDKRVTNGKALTFTVDEGDRDANDKAVARHRRMFREAMNGVNLSGRVTVETGETGTGKNKRPTVTVTAWAVPRITRADGSPEPATDDA